MTRIIPPVIGLAWVAAQLAATAVAGGRRRFAGQAVIAGTLEAGSFALGVAALRRFGRVGTTSNPLQPSEASTLVTDGVYGYTRNPMYLSLLMQLLAVAVGTGRLRSLLALPGAVWSLRAQIEAEEAALADQFGEHYATYCARVPRWL